ncbi:dTMP kinase [Candidatus Daviesbacteria bacterium]|nr:dTMP kinase [Candidatus Daviesbacteria bacterium]
MGNLYKKGKFLVLEGQGFTGKTKQAHLLVEKLKEKGIEVVETQEPGGVESAISIREELLKRRAENSITPEEEVELFYKSREKFLNELVLPNLEQGKWVVSTRFSASTFVYQGFVDGVSLDLIQKLEDEVVNGNQPDLYILIDVSEEEIMRRMKSSDREKHGYNESDLDIIKKRREGYLKLTKENINGNWVIVDGNGTIMEVFEEVWGVVKEKFSLK